MQYLSVLALIFSPILAGVLLFSPIFKNNEVRIRRFSKGFASLHFLYSLLFLFCFNPLKNDISFSQNVNFWGSDWIQPLGIKMQFGFDSLSLLMVVLTSFIFLLALIASKSTITVKHKFYYSMIFLLQSAVLGVSCARDMFLFFMFWELELIPMYFLIGQWGHSVEKNKAKASAMKFVLYTFFGSMFMLLGILLLHFYSFATYGVMTADFSKISVSAPDFPMFLQVIISILLLIGFAVKLPIVPLHTWLPDAHTDAPTPVSMILAAILLKMGAFGIIRFNMQLLPEAFKVIVPYLVIFAVVNIVYTALIAYSQTDIKRVVAYSSISNMGIVLLGLCSLNTLGFSGAIFQMIAHGIISAGLFMLVGVVYNRTKTREIKELSGLGTSMPRLMAFGLILALGAVGVPLLMSFVGEFLVFLGAFNSSIYELTNNIEVPVKLYTIISAVILILSAAYILRLVHKTFFSNVHERWNNLRDIISHEFVVLFTLSAAVVFFGLFPMTIINLIQPLLIDILQFLQV